MNVSLLPELTYIVHRIERSDEGCWEWTGSDNGTGYGTYGIAGTKGYSHRLLYTRCVGPIPDGMVIDHLCRNTRCCNPEHLEPVTPAENALRSPLIGAKTRCRHGHDFTPENTYTSPAGARRCRACQARRNRERRARGGNL